MAEKTTKIHLKDLELKELLRYEQASRMVCARYENGLKRYDNSLALDTEEYKNFEKYNHLHGEILLELENRLNNIG